MRHLVATIIGGLLLALIGGDGAQSASTCIHPWAEVGDYKIEGSFRDRVERAAAHLTNACRVTINLPGVSTGGPVKANGGCLQFTFKVQKQPETFVAKWCGGTAIVPWNGRDMLVTVYRVRQKAPQTW